MRHDLGWVVKRSYGELWYQKVAPYFILLVILAGLIFACFKAFALQERKQCTMWGQYEREQTNFKVSEQMAEMCAEYKITFNP